jgi:Transposase DDE domain
VEAATRSSDGSSITQRCRKRIEEIFGWVKEAAGFSSVKVRGKPRVNATFTLAVAAYNLIRIPKLLTRSAA